MKNKKLIDILILVCLFLAAISSPVDIFTKNETIIYSLRIVFKLAFVVFLLYYNKRNDIASFSFDKIDKRTLHILPLFLICFCNMYYLLFNLNEVYYEGSIYLLIIQVIEALATSIAEELLFRFIIQNNINIENKAKKIIYSAAIFGLFHIVNFLSSFSPYDLTRILYAFAMGIVLGLMYEYTNNIIPSIIFHFIFNAINNVLYVYLYHNSWSFMFVLNAIIVSVCGAIYIALFYIFKLKNLWNDN